MKRYFLISVLVMPLIACFSAVSTAQTAFAPSAALNALIDQVDRTYLAPRQDNFRAVINRDSPVMAALLLGFAMHGQVQYLGRMPDSVDRMVALQNEVRKLLNVVCQARNNRDTDGGPVTGDQVFFEVFYPTVRGESNEIARNMYGVDPGQVRQPFLLDRVAMPNQPRNPPPNYVTQQAPTSAPAPNTGPSGKLINRQNNAVCLLGECAPRVENRAFPCGLINGVNPCPEKSR